MTEQLLAVKQAIEDQSLVDLASSVDELSDQFGTDKAHSLIRVRVLPKLPNESLCWFWESITSPVQRVVLIDRAAGQAITDLKTGGYEIGKDFSFIQSENGRKLILTTEARRHLERVTPNSKRMLLPMLTEEVIAR